MKPKSTPNRKKSKFSKNLQSAAYHEAGHAVACWKLRIGIKEISINSDASGSITHTPVLKLDENYDKRSGRRARVESMVMVCMAGPIAQKLFNTRGYRHYHSESDREGIDYFLSQQTGGFDKEFYAYRHLLEIRTENLLKQPLHWGMVKALAEALLKTKVLKRKKIRNYISATIKEMIPSP